MSQYVPPGGTFRDLFIVANGQSDADAPPTAQLFHNGVLDGAVAVTVTHAGTGIYSLSAVVPNTYAVGDEVVFIFSYILATVHYVVSLERVTLVDAVVPFVSLPSSPPPTPPANPFPTEPIMFVQNIAGQNNLFARLDRGEYSVNATTGAVETRNTANLAAHLIPLSDAITAGSYLGAVPPNTPAGRYSISIFQTAGGAPGGYALVGADYAPFDWSGNGVLPIPPFQNQVTGYLYFRDPSGNIDPTPGRPVTFQLLDPGAASNAWGTNQFQVLSDATGLVYLFLYAGGSYRAHNLNGDWVVFTAGLNTPYQLPEILGAV